MGKSAKGRLLIISSFIAEAKMPSGKNLFPLMVSKFATEYEKYPDLLFKKKNGLRRICFLIHKTVTFLFLFLNTPHIQDGVSYKRL